MIAPIAVPCLTPRRALPAGLLVAVLLLCSGVPRAADASPDLARARNCNACHAVDRKLIGPSFRDIAARYAGNKNAAAMLVKKVREGGSGTWGQIPMPTNPQVSAEEAARLVAWILERK